MLQPVAETLKLILRPPARIALPRHGRLSALFLALQAVPPARPAHEIEDEIWAIWTSHDDPALEARMQRAISAIARRRLSEGATLLDTLVQDAPDWAEAWNKRATLHFLAQRDDPSIADIRRTLELEPRHFGAICGFAQICLRQGEIAAAIEALAAALNLNPHLDGARAMLAQLSPAPPRRLN
jgi:tetratricopeptide (TPR) repeat protein